jgi:hypothetical protein
MKIKMFILLVIFQFSVLMNAQSKQEAIDFIKDNFLQNIEQNGRFSDIKITDLDECKLVLNWKNTENENIQMMYFINGMYISESGKIKYDSKMSRPRKIGFRNGKYDVVVAIAEDIVYIKPDKKEVIAKYFQKLGSFCEEKIISWKSKQQAWEWLRENFMKYGYAKYSIDTENGSYFPKDIKDISLDRCDVVITYNVYKGGWNNTLDGTLTERIPLKSYRLSDTQQNLQNDDNNSEPVITIQNTIENQEKKSYMSVLKIASYSDIFVQNIDNAMVYLKSKSK